MKTNTTHTNLEHSGIMGMHWGRRKGTSVSAGEAHVAKSADNKTTSVNTDRRMTDEELKARVSRLQLEKVYGQLTKKETSPGKKIITDIFVNSGKTVAQAYVTKMMTQYMEKATNKSGAK